MSVLSAADEAGAIRVILRDVRSLDSPCIVVIPTTVFSSVVSSGYRRAPFWRYDTLWIVPGFLFWRPFDMPCWTVIDKCGQATKGVWWMPWRREAMKDVVACDMLRGTGKQVLIRRFLNAETRRSDPPSLHGECIAVSELTWGTETSKYPEEKKETSIP